MGKKIVTAFRAVDNNCQLKNYQYHSHNRFEIYIFHSGNSRYVIGDHIYDLQREDIIIMDGLTLHRADPVPNGPYERSVIEFSKTWIEPLLESLSIPELLSPFYKLNNSLFRGVDKVILSDIKKLMQKIHLSVLQGQLNTGRTIIEERFLESKIVTLLIQLLLKIYEMSKSKFDLLSPIQTEKGRHVERIITFIQEKFDTDISLSNIANNLNISKYYMCRIFKEITGLTIMQFLMNCRLNRAKYLLEMDPNKSIMDVSLYSGFESTSHFSRYFRQQLNMTPTEYRKKSCGKISRKVL